MIFALQTNAVGIEHRVKTLLEKAISFYKEKVPDLKYIEGIYINETYTVSLNNASKMVEKRRNETAGYIFIVIRDDYFENELSIYTFPAKVWSFIKSIPGVSVKMLEYNIPEKEFNRFFNHESTQEEPDMEIDVQPKESKEILHAINTAPTKKLKYTWMNRMKEKAGSFLDELISLKRSKSSPIIVKCKIYRNKSQTILSVPFNMWVDALKTLNPLNPNLTKPIPKGILQLAIFDQLYKVIPD